MWKEKYSKFIKDRESLKDILITGINVTLILLALNLLSINLTIAESTLMLASTTYILLGVIIVNLPFKRLYRSIIRRRKTENTSFSKIIIGLVLILLSFILLLVTKIQMLWLAFLPLFISGIDITLQGVEKKQVADEGIKIACEQIAEFKETKGIAGVHLMPIEWEHKVPEIAERANMLPRPVFD